MNAGSTPRRRMQFRALAISVVALLIPVAGAIWVPEGLSDYEALLWLLALIPAFLLAYERGSRGVATALAFGMAALSITYAVGRAFGHPVPRLLWAVVLTYLLLSFCLGWLSQRFITERSGSRSVPPSVDPLTALPDHQYANFHLDIEFSAAGRGRPLAVVLIQLDDLRGLRMRHGGVATDDMLRAFGERVARVTRRMNLAARYREDTFLCVLGDCDDRGALVFAQRLHDALRDSYTGVDEVPTTSIGIAVHHPSMTRASQLMAEADRALTSARKDGGDRIRFSGRTVELTAIEELEPDAHGRGAPDVSDYPASAASTIYGRPGRMGTGRRVLIFAPSPDTRAGLEEEFRRERFEVDAAATLPEAIGHLPAGVTLLVVDLAAGAAAHALIADARSRTPATRTVGVWPEALPRSAPHPLSSRVEAYYRPADGFDVFRRTLAELLAEYDWLVATVIRNRQLTDELRVTSRESRLAVQRSEEILNRSQKMDAVGRLAGGIAHDFNNLLTTVRGHAELLISDLPEHDPVRDELTEIRDAAQRATALTRQLLAFSSRQVMQPRVIDLTESVRDLDRMLRRLIGEDVELFTDIPDSPLRVRADPTQIDQVLMNLAVNARDAMPDGGRLMLSLGFETLMERNELGLGLEPGGYALITVSDSGHGMDEATAARIFEPFFTTKEAGKGTGLGLSTAYGIIRQSGGHIAVESKLDIGTTFRILLPRVDESAPEPDVQESKTNDTQPYAASEATILLVEDEAPVRNLVIRILKRNGFTVLSADNADSALRLVRENGEPIDLLITDVIMPGMGGPDLARGVRQLRPDVQVLFISGYSEDAIPTHGIMVDNAGFLQKPFTPEELTRRVGHMLSRD